ncbi:MAG: 2TM domain-containing protein [Marinicellaceae bacterium]
MFIKDKRLEKGWTQSQLAEYSGLSLRTIQRIEKGKTPTVESQKALAAVFETSISDLTFNHNINESLLNELELEELKHVRKIKDFFKHLLIYFAIVPFLIFINWTHSSNWEFGIAIGWGWVLIFEAIDVFDSKDLFGAGWEKRHLEKRIGRKVE